MSALSELLGKCSGEVLSICFHPRSSAGEQEQHHVELMKSAPGATGKGKGKGTSGGGGSKGLKGRKAPKTVHVFSHEQAVDAGEVLKEMLEGLGDVERESRLTLDAGKTIMSAYANSFSVICTVWE